MVKLVTVLEKQTCSRCKGTGKLGAKLKCSACSGGGQIEVEILR